MLHLKALLFCILYGSLSVALDKENEEQCTFDTTKLLPSNALKTIKIKVQTNLTAEINKSKDQLSQQMDQIKDEVKTQKEELLRMEKNDWANPWDANFNCTKNCGPLHDLPSSCEEAMTNTCDKDGAYLLHIPKNGLRPFYAYCKRVGNETWTVIQRREDGSVDFYRDWIDYKLGFGNLYGEYWLGLERLHAMTTQDNHELYIWLENDKGETRYARYSKFSIANETEEYRLTISGYTGNDKDHLVSGTAVRSHNGMKFTTRDNDNDRYDKGNCAFQYKGGWWFTNCYRSHLNGRYIKDDGSNQGIAWIDFDKYLRYSQMAIRRVIIT